MKRHLALAALLILFLVAGAVVAGRLAPAPPPASATGRVSDGAGPVAGACVRIKATTVSAVTAADGTFRLTRRRAGRVTAAKEGYFITGANPGAGPLGLFLERLPSDDNEEYQWVSPDADPAGRHNCANCHAEIHREWSLSAHARSAAGRRFLNLYDGHDWRGRPDVGWSLLRDKPDGAGVCNACHVPTLPFDAEAPFDARTARGVAARGVHCDYCHKIQGPAGGEVGLAHGRFGLRLLRPRGGQLFFGPLDDVDRGDESFSPFYRDSRYCASCHEGTVFGVHAYGTYTEWLGSPARRAGKHCQTCHMAPTGRLTNLAPGRGGVERDPATLANHRFFAGSREEMLRRAVTLSLRVEPDGGRVRADVEVRADGAGHRVPTGFADRHLLLVVGADDADGRPLAALTGPVLPSPAGREQAGKPGHLFAKLLRDHDGRAPAPFWNADPEAHDTRLTPGVPERLAFTFPAGAARVRARLHYRRFWREVEEVKGWPGEETVVAEKEAPSCR